ncbi:Cd(II)/Pb(II)-responsive transcriptional regulator [Azohydromonas caseinilytica]|uniref:Cd(II)/Pb(II)-responsive transcriptional regulator n=1 Tax=Azohydromonas caseinilytica TaxID=2728836 RepID=A0A848FE26_9BURK|nr:Cd(II)/Pb(II)-responsive transcriptional regulator [Azohydromonas caseinilytica]NML17065.1 Cd(II)/Pb(II)-responsive transcriptional regulator [Azohydromonas caseinilytica]
MKIGELANTTGIQVETIRFYEREGLLPLPPRTSGNYRVYDTGHVERLAFIRHCRSLDMTLDEIRVLLHYKDAPHDNCGEVNALLDEHIGHVERRIQQLRTLQKELKELRRLCNQGQPARDCGILNELAQAASQTAEPGSRPHSHVKGAHRHGDGPEPR